MTITLTPEEIVLLHQGLRKITEFADRSTVVADAIGIDQRHRKKLRDITRKIYNQGLPRAYRSKLNTIENE